MWSVLVYIPLLFMPVIIYIVIAFIVVKFFYYITKSKKVLVCLILFFVVFPSWKVPIKIVIREYYLHYKSDTIMYEKIDWVDGKIESLNMYDLGGFGSGRLKNLKKKLFDYIQI